MYPQLVWEPLSQSEKENFNRWLLQINDYPLHRNNWQFFKVLVNVGFKKVGGRYSRQEIEETLKFLDTNYLGDGWYSDGVSEKRDYYAAFAMHFYSLIYAVVMRQEDPHRSAEYIARSKQFAKDFIYFFNEDGKALPFGRSLTYRFAQCAFFSALAYAGEYVCSWGVMRGIIGRHMRWRFNQPKVVVPTAQTYEFTDDFESYGKVGTKIGSGKWSSVLSDDKKWMGVAADPTNPQNLTGMFTTAAGCRRDIRERNSVE